MKKSELIKRRHDVTIEIEYELRNGCYKCPLFIRTGGYTTTECDGCFVGNKLKDLGEELIKITSIYRKSKNIPAKGTALAEVTEKHRVREMLEEKFDELEFKIMRSRGKTYNDIGRHYGVSGDMIRRFSIEKITGEAPEVNRRQFVDYKAIDKMITIKDLNEMRKQGKKLNDIAISLGITLNSLNKWIRKKKSKI